MSALAPAVCISLDDDAITRLDELVEMSSVKTNKSKVLRELINKEYVLQKEVHNA